MKKKLFLNILIFIFIVLFLFSFFYFNPSFFPGFVVKDFSNYSNFTFESKFLYNNTFVLPSNVVVKAIVFDGFLITDDNPNITVFFNNTSVSFYDNNSNIVAFATKILNLSKNLSFNNLSNISLNSTINITNNLSNNTINFTNSSNNFSLNNSNITINQSINNTVNVTINNTTNNTINTTKNNTINITNNTINQSNLTNYSINFTNQNNITINQTLNNTNFTINQSNLTNQSNSTNNQSNQTNITILNYGNGFFDYNNDGVVSKNDAVDFVVSNFSNDSCVLWSVVSKSNSFFVCSGSNTCCSSYGLNSSFNDSYFVLNYNNILSDYGVVLAKKDNFSWSDPLTFNFTGKEEKTYNLNDCGNLCNLNITTNKITIKTNGLFYGNITIYYEKNSSCIPNKNSNWTVFLEDNCKVNNTINIYPYSLIIKGFKGNFTITKTGNLTVKSLDFTPDDFNGDAYFNIEPGGILNVKP